MIHLSFLFGETEGRCEGIVRFLENTIVCTTDGAEIRYQSVQIVGELIFVGLFTIICTMVFRYLSNYEPVKSRIDESGFQVGRAFVFGFFLLGVNALVT